MEGAAKGTGEVSEANGVPSGKASRATAREKETVRSVLVLTDKLKSGNELATMLADEIEGEFVTAVKFIPPNIGIEKLKKLIERYRRQAESFSEFDLRRVALLLLQPLEAIKNGLLSKQYNAAC